MYVRLVIVTSTRYDLDFFVRVDESQEARTGARRLTLLSNDHTGVLVRRTKNDGQEIGYIVGWTR